MSQEIVFGKMIEMLANMEPDEPVKNVVSGNPQTTFNELVKGEGFESGVWSCSAGAFEINSYSINEVMLLVAGSMSLTDLAGKTVELKEGDMFFIPKGWSGTWTVHQDMQKMYVIMY
ncbi:MAG: cupin domain-containing protein [Anaerolineae bacterium]